MHQQITLQDIADYCGLSKSTVAKVISNPQNTKVRPVTVSKVLAAAKKLNYTTNFAAKMLRTQRSNTIGVIFPNVNSFYRELVTHLDSQLAKRGYFGLFSFWDPLDKKTYLSSYKRMRDHGVDGIITNDKDESIPDMDIPTVIYGNRLRVFDCVYPDKLDYARRAVLHLHEMGHEKIGFIGAMHDPRFQAICDELRRLNLEVCPEWLLQCSAYMRNGYDMMRYLLKQSKLPTAVILHSDHLAFGVIRAAEEAAIRIPEDLSILSYDNLAESEFSNPPLTTFDQRYEYAAEQLVDILLKRIQNPSLSQQCISYVMPLVERKSVKNLKTGEHK